MGHLIRLPDLHQSYHDARRVLRSADATPAEIDTALDVLDCSREWADIDLCRHVREAARRAAPRPQPRNSLTDAQFARIMQRAPVRKPAPHGMAAFALPIAIVCALYGAVWIEGQWTVANYRAVYAAP